MVGLRETDQAVKSLKNMVWEAEAESESRAEGPYARRWAQAWADHGGLDESWGQQEDANAERSWAAMNEILQVLRSRENSTPDHVSKDQCQFQFRRTHSILLPYPLLPLHISFLFLGFFFFILFFNWRIIPLQNLVVHTSFSFFQCTPPQPPPWWNLNGNLHLETEIGEFLCSTKGWVTSAAFTQSQDETWIALRVSPGLPRNITGHRTTAHVSALAHMV